MLAGKAGIVEVQAYVDGEAISLLLDTEPSPKEEQKVDSVAGWERIDITDLQVGDVFRDGMGIYFNVQVCVWLGPHTNYHSYVVPYPGEDDEPHLYSSGGGIVVEGYHVWRCTTPPASLVETAFEAYEGR